uniref:Beta-defensin n=2 Tax=Marmotini TaxID=337730 RepID=A0A8C9Q6K0_SPEDA
MSSPGSLKQFPPRPKAYEISCAEDQGLCRWKCRKPENELNYYCENRKKCCMIGFPTAISQTTEASKIETTSIFYF